MLVDDGEDVIRVHDIVFLAVQFDFSAAKFVDEDKLHLLISWNLSALGRRLRAFAPGLRPWPPDESGLGLWG